MVLELRASAQGMMLAIPREKAAVRDKRVSQNGFLSFIETLERKVFLTEIRLQEKVMNEIAEDCPASSTFSGAFQPFQNFILDAVEAAVGHHQDNVPRFGLLGDVGGNFQVLLDPDSALISRKPVDLSHHLFR